MRKVSKGKKNERIAMLVSLIVISILLCIPFINKTFIGVFGYAIYVYIVALFGVVVFLLKGYQIALPLKKIILYLCIFFSILITLHIGLAKEFIVGGWGSYIFDSYSNPTVGGMLVSIATSIVVVPLGYLGSLILFFLLTSTLIFTAIFPHLITKSSKQMKAEKKKKILQKLSGENKSVDQQMKVLNIEKEEKQTPLTVEEYDTEPIPKTKEDARTLLFGDKPKLIRTSPRKVYDIADLKINKKEPTKEKDSYDILPNVSAQLIKPKDEWYTNNFIQNKKTTKAKEVLLSTTLEEDYENRYGAIPPKAEAPVQETFDINSYSPKQENEEVFVQAPAYVEHKERFINEEKNVQPSRLELSKQQSTTIFDNTNNYQSPISKVEYTNTQKETTRVEPQKETARMVEPTPRITKQPQSPQKRAKKPYIYPHAGLLDNYESSDFDPVLSEEEYTKYKDILERTLDDFGISATVFNAIKGPTVTRFELRLSQGAGNSVNKVLNLQKDLRMVLESDGEINILAPIRGKNAIGIEVPNVQRGIVSLKETICTQEFQKDKKGIKLALGKTLEGKAFIGDLEDMPHLLVAGATGTGKSVCINTIITSILFQHSPDEVKLLLIDPKKVELINYIGLPHLLIKEPLVEIKEIITALKWIREETSQRFNKFKDMRVVNINAYNNIAKEKNLEPIPKIVIVIDEASELMTKAKKEVEDTLSSLARIGRAAGIHLIFATQSPTKDVITSEIQNNLNTKIAFAVSDYVHSQVIFKANGAEKLLGKGDMYLKGSGGELTRIQCSYVDPKEIQKVVGFIMENNESDFDETINEAIFKKEEPQPVGESASEIKAAKADDAFMESVKEALKIGLTMKRISISMLQRKMEKGYNGAAKIIDYLEENGYIDVPDGTNRRREVLLTVEQFVEMYPEEREDMLGMK